MQSPLPAEGPAIAPVLDLNGTIGEIDPAPLVAARKGWTKLVGPLVSLLILVAVVSQLRSLNFAELFAMVPRSVSFWAIFTVSYLFAPFTEWVIFRRLWELPVSGFAALLRKLVSNEILLGYLGEVYFYAWARRHAHVVAAPFGAIKDVTILSAFTGNIATLALVAISAPMLGSLHLEVSGRTFFLSAGFVLVTSFAMMLLRKTIFTLPRRELWFITNMHFLRIGVTTILAALMWHLLLPEVALGWWVLLAAMRLLLSRLPLIPNKDVVFAGLAAFLVGRDTEIVNAMALMATLILAAHLVVGTLLGISGLMRESRS